MPASATRFKLHKATHCTYGNGQALHKRGHHFMPLARLMVTIPIPMTNMEGWWCRELERQGAPQSLADALNVSQHGPLPAHTEQTPPIRRAIDND